MTTYYIKKNNQIMLSDKNKSKIQTTLKFTPQFKGLEIKETEKEIILKDGKYRFIEDIQDELLQEAKESKYLEANQKAKEYLESGNALYELTQTRHIEATDGNIGKLTAYALGYVTGLYKPTDSVYWNTKEDETIALSQEELGEVLSGLGQVQANVWNIQYPQYLAQIKSAQTTEDINSIEVEYSDVLMS